mgnify:CR=1 FL=1
MASFSKIIISSLLIALAKPGTADKFNCFLTFGGEGIFADLIIGSNKAPTIHDGQICAIQCPLINTLFDNCYVDKMKNANKITIKSVIRSCERIACNPTFFQKLKYK